MPIQVTEDLLRAIAVKEKALSDGRTLSKKGAFRETHRLEDDSLLWGLCQGSGAKPYVLSIDLAGDHPTIRCTCPVKPPPCKHTLGLLVHFIQSKDKFSVAEAPAELLEKREKNVARAEKRAEAATKPKEVNKAALEKKTKQQRDGLELLEKLVLDVAGSGLGAINPKRAESIKNQARQLRDAYLPGAAIALTRLAAMADADGTADTDYSFELKEPGDDLPDEQRHRVMARHLHKLWAMVRRGQRHLDEKLDEGETQDEADAVVEDLLGKIWQLAELKAQGKVKRDLSLLELAFERYDDQVREERVEQGFIFDLGDGTVYATQAYRPYKALDKVPGQPSYQDALAVSEAVIYPGFVNRRIRWELGVQTARPATAEQWAKLHQLAQPDLAAAVSRYKEQIKNPLAPEDAVFLIRATNAVRQGEDTVLIDDKKGRLILRDSPLARTRTTNNFNMAAGCSLDAGHLRQPASVLVRLWLGIDDNLIFGQPLALVIANAHIRLGA